MLDKREAALRRSIRRSLWSELTKRFPRRELPRIAGMFDIWTGDRVPELAEHQGFKGLFVPDLPTKPWLDLELFPFVADLRASLPVLQRELDALLRAGTEFPSYGQRHTARLAENGTPFELPVPGWRDFTFREHSTRLHANCRRCPETAKLVQRISKQVGTLAHCGFLILLPGSRLDEHVDEVNHQVAVHMGVLVPRRSGVRVAGKTRMHGVGKVLAFDNSFSHSAWNNGDSMRIIFGVYSSHPGLTSTEVAALQFLRPVLAELSRRSPESAQRTVPVGRRSAV